MDSALWAFPHAGSDYRNVLSGISRCQIIDWLDQLSADSRT